MLYQLSYTPPGTVDGDVAGRDVSSKQKLGAAKLPT